MKRNYGYVIVNFVVFLLAGVIFYQDYSIVRKDFESGVLLAVTAGTAVLVYLIKAVRLYIALYGADITLPEHMELFFRTVPVSLLFPFKLGDLFRAYCYGYRMENYLEGAIVILLDRFVDSLALAGIIFIMNSISGLAYPLIFYVLAAFLLFFIVCYLLFPPVCRYWKKYFIRSVASVKRNACLKVLSRMEHTYGKISAAVKGRFAVLYIISLLAWAIEIGRLAVFDQVVSRSGTMRAASDYLLSALIKTESAYLRQFISIGVPTALTLFLLLRCTGAAVRKGGQGI